MDKFRHRPNSEQSQKKWVYAHAYTNGFQQEFYPPSLMDTAVSSTVDCLTVIQTF